MLARRREGPREAKRIVRKESSSLAACLCDRARRWLDENRGTGFFLCLGLLTVCCETQRSWAAVGRVCAWGKGQKKRILRVRGRWR